MSATVTRTGPPWSVAILAIALNTFREAIRDRILYLLAVFALGMIGVSRLLALLTVGDEAKIIKDVGLSAISVFGVLTAVFVGVSLVFKEIERRTIYTLLANPVARWQFIAGKFSGLVAVVGLNVGVMSAALLALVALRGEDPGSLVPALVLIVVELGVIVAFALLYSSLTNPMLAALFTFATYVTGHLSFSLKLLADKLGDAPSATLCAWLYRVLPNLSYLDLKSEAVRGLGVESSRVLLATAYGTGYSLLVLALACAVFQRRDFK